MESRLESISFEQSSSSRTPFGGGSFGPEPYLHSPSIQEDATPFTVTDIMKKAEEAVVEKSLTETLVITS